MFASFPKTRLLLTCLLAVTIGPASLAQNPLPPAPKAPMPKTPVPPTTPTPGPQQPSAPAQVPAGGRPGGPGGAAVLPPKPGPKPYKDVITAEAKSEVGVFTVHRIDERILFEIPAKQLNKEMLWSAEIEQLPTGVGAGYSGASAGHKVVRFTRRNNTVYLRLVNYSARSEAKGGAIARAVEAASLEPIAVAFNVEAEGTDKSAVIDVTRLFTTDPTEFSVKNALGGVAVDPSRSYLEKTKAFPTNIEVKSLLTFIGGGAAGGRGGGGSSSITAMVHYSLVQLPEKPMMPRLFDSRVGYFAEGFEDYGRPENRVVEREYIDRYRLEKKDPTAAVSEPVKQIVYYISREVPEEWHPYIKKGVEAWNAAYEQAGFKNAIICKDAPTVKEDPDWDPEDVRYSVIRWAPTPTENAMGPNIHDPRTGEILSAHIIIWHNVLKLGETWYFTQVGDMDPRARQLPLPPPLMGEILQYIVCHEVGHTLGLRHNHKASSFYTAAQLRDKAFTDINGDEASIMDYGRFNYVAQPGDNARLIPILGPYDRFAIEWGYKPLGLPRPDDEKTELDKIAARQVSNPMLRFGGEDANSVTDPTVQTEDLGSDPVEATGYGLKNINRIAHMLVPATTKYGENYDILGEMYSALWAQRARELSNVLKVVGGIVQTDYHSGHGTEVYSPVPAKKQQEAVKFLLDNAFTTPYELLLTDVLNRIQVAGVQDLVLRTQRGLLNSLLNDSRTKRMADIQAITHGKTYSPAMLMRDVQAGIWSELYTPAPAIDIYRRNLQRAYLETMKTKVQSDNSSPTDSRALATADVQDLMRTIDRALLKTIDTDTRMHLVDCHTTIERMLKPPVVVNQSSGPTLAQLLGLGTQDKDIAAKEKDGDLLPDGPEIHF